MALQRWGRRIGTRWEHRIGTQWGGVAPPLALIASGALAGNTTLTRTTTANYWGL